MSGIRQRIAARLVESQQKTASLTTFNEADLHAVNELRARYKESFKEKHGVSLGYTSFFVKATVEAIKAFPIVNARIDGAEIVHQHFYDIGIAVSTDRGLMVPVLRGADSMSFSAIEKSVAEMATKARSGKIAVADLQGGTFTITNGGSVRLAAVDAHFESAADRNSRLARDSEAARRARGSDRHSADDVSRAHVRSSPDRWSRRSAIPRPHQGRHRESRATDARNLAGAFGACFATIPGENSQFPYLE